MSKFKKYLRTDIAELREVTKKEVEEVLEFNCFLYSEYETVISISKEDQKNGSPKMGDMIARNPENHRDQWLVAKEYFRVNFA